MTSLVYFLQVQPYGPVKIGCTAGNVCLRVQALQQTSPHELKWIGCYSGNSTDEAAAHERFSASRVRGEWFHPTPDLMAFIAEKSPEFSPEAIQDGVYCEPLRQEIKRFIRDRTRGSSYSLAWQVADAAGTDIWTLQKWLMRERMVDEEIAIRAAEYVRNAA